MNRPFVPLLLVMACTPPAEQPPPPPPPPPVEAPLPYALGLTVNDATGGPAYQGWALVLRADATWFGDDGPEVALDASGPALTVTAADGSAAAWPWKRTSALPASSPLGPTAPMAEATWTLTAEQTAALAPGRYTLSARWGEADALRTVDLVAEPAPLTAELRRARALRAIEGAEAAGDAAATLALVDAALAEHPGDVTLLTRKALTHEQLGQLLEARLASEAALTAFAAQAWVGPREPSRPLAKLRQRLRARLLRDGGF